MTPLQIIQEGQKICKKLDKLVFEIDTAKLINIGEETKVMTQASTYIKHQTIALLEAQNKDLEERKWEFSKDEYGIGAREALQTTIDINNKLIEELRV